MASFLGAPLPGEGNGEVELRPPHVRGRGKHSGDRSQSNHLLYFVPHKNKE